MIKAIPTEYKGYRFRSRLEARWAVFFDACGVEWEYEPEGFDLGNGTYYLPDFLLHGVGGRAAGDLYIEVKGNMTMEDARKIKLFARHGSLNADDDGKFDPAILVVGKIPDGETAHVITHNISQSAYNPLPGGLYQFNFETIDGDNFAAHPGVNRNGRFELFGDDSSYLWYMDPRATARAYRLARQARFEHGEKPKIRRYIR